MKETWSAMRKIIAPIMFVALATAGMTVAGSTAANATTTAGDYRIRSTNSSAVLQATPGWANYYSPDMRNLLDTQAKNSTSVRTWHVTNNVGVAASGVTVTMVAGKAYSGSSATGTLNGNAVSGNEAWNGSDQATATAVTDENGDVSFTLTNTGGTSTQTAAFINPNVNNDNYISGDSFDIVDIAYAQSTAGTYRVRSTNTGTTVAAAPGWAHYYSPDMRNLTQTLTKGATSVRTWHVTNNVGVAASGVTVTMVAGKAYSGSTAAGALNGNAVSGTEAWNGNSQATATAVTDANGDVSFTLTNTGGTSTQLAAWVNPNNNDDNYISGDTFDVVDVTYEDAPVVTPESSGSKTITFDGSTYDSLASAYGCDWWTSANDAKADGTFSTGKALQCSHPGVAGVRLNASGTKSFTNSGNASVSFSVFSMDAPATIKVRIVAEGVAAPEATLSVPTGWSTQTVDFSGVAGYNSTGSYKRLDIEGSGEGHFWVDNINLYLNLSAPVAPETPVSGVFLSFGANDDLAKAVNTFEGATGAIVDGQYEFTATGEAWSGMNLINTSSNRRLTSTAKPVLTFDYTNPDSSSESVMVKLEGNGPAALLGLTAVPGINHFSVDFSTVTGWDGASTYKNLAIFPGFGGDVQMANTARTGQVYIIDNVSFNGGTSADVYTAPADAFNAEAILVSSSLNGPAAPIGNDWWHGNAPADNFVKYVNAGSTFTITYRIANASTHAALAGKTVTLTPTSPDGNTGPTAAVTATSDSNGEATFTITNTNTNSTSESYRADSANWSDPIGAQYKYEFKVTGVSGADAVTRSDNIWGHVVTTAVPAYSGDVTLKSSTLVGPGASVGNGWWHGNAPADNIVKYIVAGQSFNLVYHVEDHTTHAAVVGKTVTLSAGGNATISGSLSAVTNSSGDATFSLTSTNTSSDAELARPTGTENAWIPVDVIGGTEYKLDFSVASLSANGSIARADNVWTHTVKAFSSSAALNGLYVKSASTTSAVIGWTPVSGASYKLTLTGLNGTKAFTKAVTVTSGSSTTVTGLPVGLLNVKASAIAYSASTVSAATSTIGAVAGLSAKAAVAPALAPVISSLVAGVRKATVTYAPVQDASNGGATFTAYQYSTDLGATWTNAPASPFEITGLANGATVKVRMRAVNVVGNKASSDKATTVLGTPKAAPAIASATGGIGTVTVAYSAVAATNTGGSAITAYQYSTNNGSTWATAPASPFVISGLGNGETVSVKMRAVNAVGNGVASATAKTATTASAPKAAPAITSVTAGTGKVTVKYTAVATANNGGSAITGYQYSINNGSTWLTAGAAAGFDISAAKGATVSVKMRAVNAVGASVASAAKANTSAVK